MAASVAELIGCLVAPDPGLDCPLARQLIARTGPQSAPKYVGVLPTLAADPQVTIRSTPASALCVLFGLLSMYLRAGCVVVGTVRCMAGLSLRSCSCASLCKPWFGAGSSSMSEEFERREHQPLCLQLSVPCCAGPSRREGHAALRVELPGSCTRHWAGSPGKWCAQDLHDLRHSMLPSC